EREAFGRTINETLPAGCAGAVLKVFAPPVRPVELPVSRVSEISEAAFQQVIRGEVGDRAVVGLEPGKRRNQPGGADVHNRHAELTQRLGNGEVFDPGDDAMAVPSRQPTR